VKAVDGQQLAARLQDLRQLLHEARIGGPVGAVIALAFEIEVDAVEPSLGLALLSVPGTTSAVGAVTGQALSGRFRATRKGRLTDSSRSRLADRLADSKRWKPPPKLMKARSPE
jgi:hypothetical protein